MIIDITGNFYGVYMVAVGLLAGTFIVATAPISIPLILTISYRANKDREEAYKLATNYGKILEREPRKLKSATTDALGNTRFEFE